MKRLEDRIARDLRRIADRAVPTATDHAWSAIRRNTVQVDVGNAQSGADLVELTPEQRPSRRRWALAAATVMTAVATGGIVLVVNGDDQQSRTVEPPAPTTPPPPTTSPPSAPRTEAQLLDELAAAFETGDAGEVLDRLSPDSDCDVPVAGGPQETCEQAIGFLAAIGAHLDPRCAANDPDNCRLRHGSDLHAILGYPDDRIDVPFVIDDLGRVELRLGELNVFQAYVGTEVVTGRLWAQLREMRPDLDTSAQTGPRLNDAEAGEALMAAARELNDPARIVASLQAELDQQDLPAHGPRICRTQSRVTDCARLFEFLYAVGADIDLDCEPAADDTSDTVSCTIAMSSDLHRALGSGHTTAAAGLEYRGGSITSLEFELAFSADADINAAIFEFASSVDGLYRAIGAADPGPVFDEESAPLWLAAAEQFAAEVTAAEGGTGS